MEARDNIWHPVASLSFLPLVLSYEQPGWEVGISVRGSTPTLACDRMEDFFSFHVAYCVSGALFGAYEGLLMVAY